MARRDLIERLARVGFAVKGVLYLLLGGLALSFALGQGGRLTDPHGALVALLAAPYGRPLTGIVAVGLALYAGWRLLEAFADANHKGHDARALGSRAIYALSGIVYGVLSFDAARLALATPGASAKPELPATIVGSTMAKWAVVVIALGLISYGVLQLVGSTRRRLSDQLSQGLVQRQVGRWPMRISRVGIAGRACVLMAMGLVLVRRATTSVPAAARTDTGDSLRLIAALPTGEWLLAGIAAGLMAYGLFQLVHARYRRIAPP